MSSFRVVIIQRYTPEYRRQFFEQLEHELNSRNIRLSLVLDKRSVEQNLNKDLYLSSIPTTFAKSIRLRFRQKYVSMREVSKLELTADLVIAEQANRDLSNWALIFARKLLGRKTAIWGHGVDYVNAKSLIGSGLRHFLILISDKLFVYTEHGHQLLLSRGISGTKLAVLDNSTDTKALQSRLSSLSAHQTSVFKQAQGLSENLIVFLGSLDPSKRLDLLFESAIKARAQIGNLSLAILGDGPLRYQVEAFEKENPWVRYLGRDSQSKHLALASARLLVIPGRVGLVATESIASGVPIVTTRIPLHAPEFYYLKEGVNCIISEPDVDSYSSAIVLGLSSDFQVKMRAGLNADAGKYTIENMVKNYVNAVEELLKGSEK